MPQYVLPDFYSLGMSGRQFVFTWMVTAGQPWAMSGKYPTAAEAVAAAHEHARGRVDSPR